MTRACSFWEQTARFSATRILYSINNLNGRNGAVVHTGDNRTGEGDGDDEAIIIDFTKIPPEIEKIAVTVTIFDAQ